MYVDGDLSLINPPPPQSPIQPAGTRRGMDQNNLRIPLGRGLTYPGLTSDESPKGETLLLADPMNTQSPKPPLARTRGGVAA